MHNRLNLIVVTIATMIVSFACGTSGTDETITGSLVLPGVEV